MVNPYRPTTKIRIVYGVPQLNQEKNDRTNEFLYRGPVMLNDLCGLLMRFRLHQQFALVTAIENVFLQIGL